jgi:hypothetical protein
LPINGAVMVLVLLLAVYWGFAAFGSLAAIFAVVIACGEGWCDDGFRPNWRCSSQAVTLRA